MDCRVCPVHNELWGLQRKDHRQGISQFVKGMHPGDALVGAGNPIIDWKRRQVTIQRLGSVITLPVVRRHHIKPIIETVNLCNAKQVERWFRRQKVDQAYLGFIRLVKDEREEKIVPVVPEKTATGCDVEKAFHEDMPKSIKAILLDYKDIFPTDLPPGLPPVRMGS